MILVYFSSSCKSVLIFLMIVSTPQLEPFDLSQNEPLCHPTMCISLTENLVCICPSAA